MSAVRSAGILLYRFVDDADPASLEVWIAHLGGPFWSHKDAGAWSIPKGELNPLDDSGEPETELAAALREFGEEIGAPAPDVPYRLLGEFRQPSGKVVIAFAAESDFSVDSVASNTFTVEWPRNSGIMREFPEVDAAGWFSATTARSKVSRGQVAIIDALESDLSG